MNDRYWEGYGDGFADKRRLEAENERLRGKYRSLVGLITHREHGNCPDACTACDAIKELRRVVYESHE